MGSERLRLIKISGLGVAAIPAREAICRVLRVFVCLLISGIPGLVLQPEAGAQETAASLTGRIVDETGAVVPDVKVRILNKATGLQRQATTGADGYFVIPLLPAGNYTLSAETPSFATINIENLTLDVSANSYIQITLRPKAISESINIRAPGDDVARGNTID